MRDHPVPCRYATLVDHACGTHRTFNDDAVCDPCSLAAIPARVAPAEAPTGAAQRGPNPPSVHASPSEAQMAAVAPLLSKIRSLPAGELPHGCAVRIDGKWFGFEGMDGGRMLLSSRGFPAAFSYEPLPDERFEWEDLIG